jgi:ferritin-like metal-binding protein YciE
MASDHDRLNRYLNEVLATERALVSTLTAHIAMTPRGPYRELLERHLRETEAHADAVSAHATGDDTSLVNLAIGLAETVVGQALTLAKGPLDLVRGGPSMQERLLKNAKDECATEALEIATYDAIEALATQLDEPEIAALAARHREEEVRMLADLRALIPTLAARPGKAETPQAGKTETPQPGNPIAGYDELNAGQIVARLSQLTQDQLAAVLAYERAHRNRRAVIEKGDELTATPPWTGYDEDSVEAILERLNGALAGAVRDYESRHRRRVEVLEAAQRELSGSA